MWIFGYGSLIWRPNFDYKARVTGYIQGWERRFYQGSPDHRGTVEWPGRVVTLTAASNARCWGAAYELDGEVAAQTLAQLDHREIAGYARIEVAVHHGEGALDALTYVAARDNPSWLGEASARAIAARIVSAHGPSGSNIEYVLRLADALREIGADDDHVFAVEAAVLAARSPS